MAILFPPPKRARAINRPPQLARDALSPKGSGLAPDNSDLGALADARLSAQQQAPPPQSGPDVGGPNADIQKIADAHLAIQQAPRAPGGAGFGNPLAQSSGAPTKSASGPPASSFTGTGAARSPQQPTPAATSFVPASNAPPAPNADIQALADHRMQAIRSPVAPMGAMDFGGQGRPPFNPNQGPAFIGNPMAPQVMRDITGQGAAQKGASDGGSPAANGVAQGARTAAQQAAFDQRVAYEDANREGEGGASTMPVSGGGARDYGNQTATPPDPYANLSPAEKQQIDDLRAQQAHERAQALEQIAARSGLGGFGLSGAAGSMQTDASNSIDRGQRQQVNDLYKELTDEDWQRLQHGAEMKQAEMQMNQDLDGDHTVAGVPVDDKTGDGHPDDFDWNSGHKAPPPKPADANGDTVPDYKENNSYGDAAKQFTGNPDEYADRSNQTAAAWDHYVGSDGQYDYYIQGADSWDGKVKKGHKFKVRRPGQ